MKKDEVKRMCCVCRERRAKAELVKVVRRTPPRQATPATPPEEGNYEFAIAEGHAEGRGAYVCKDGKCIEMAVKKRALNRSFKCEVPNGIYEKLGNHPAS